MPDFDMDKAKAICGELHTTLQVENAAQGLVAWTSYGEQSHLFCQGVSLQDIANALCTIACHFHKNAAAPICDQISAELTKILHGADDIWDPTDLTIPAGVTIQ